jgi:glycosyltransferase involved in cell wall biosynthesis
MDLVHTEWSRMKYILKNFEQIVALKSPHDAWIILDDGTEGDAAARRHGVAEERIHFLPNGINIEWIDQHHDRTSARRDLGVSQDAPVVLFLARFVASKRADLVVRAIPRTLKRASDAMFLFVGDGPERPRCEALARDLGVADHAIFTGAKRHEQVPEIMAAADVFASVSNLSNAAIPTCEAMVCGVPAVVFDVGNTRDVVHDGENGIVVADGDVTALADAIASLLEDPDRRAGMSQDARRLAKEKFTGWEERIDMEIDIIRSLTDSQTV